MSDRDNAGYRLLSFKYTPTKPATRKNQSDEEDNNLGQPDNKSRTSTASTGEEPELPSLSSLASALPVIDATTPSKVQHDLQISDAETKGGAGVETEGKDQPEAQVLTNFHLFGDLPTELRIKVWHLTFLPRVVELHPTRPNYARDDGRQQQWQSGCSNPAALSVSSEAREIALEHFRIAYPLASITSQQETPGPFARYAVPDIGTYAFSGASLNGKAGLRRRTLHISPEYDTVALLGQDTDFTKLSRLRDSFRDADPKGFGIKNLALSTTGWGYGGSAAMMRSLDRRILKDLDQLTLFMYSEPLPPLEWRARGASLDEQTLACFRKTGNRCELVPCTSEGSNAWYAYKLWRGGKGRQFWDDEGKILRVGKNEMKIQDLRFSDGW
ncbi:hypothetical protein N8I77_009834 [Diaporthe amygdali]|uniref:2EXR domain-containing protein n=1 Tax=Phomopsis amygdali TaxID=1214568 RepID=A0AAD9SC64_PHOAM|nr:hypothetical protein N8I77_009834 [Diaporthe amygdali]